MSNVEINGTESPEELNRKLLDGAEPMPEGYTHFSFFQPQGSMLQYFTIVGEGVPAMVWHPDYPDGPWLPLFPGKQKAH